MLSAVPDGMLHHCRAVNIKGDSYGLKDRRKDGRDGLFASFEFRMYCPESENNLLVFEKTLGCLSYEEDKIRAFRDECRGPSEKLLATPGYFEEGTQ
ncbi:MAG: hypothetical protein M1151_05345 [Candidatus Thermoplasmatota archaeon]|nr:hypothetical protein [Candidatus Thermoplasmatota archaeon]